MAEIWHPHLVLWEAKAWLDRSADLKTMSAVLPDCLLIKVPGIGHSMNPKSTALYAGWCSAGWPEVK
jgi:hypothetical protein